MRYAFKAAVWLSRGVIVLMLVVSAYDLIHFSINPSAYPIPSTEMGDPRYSSAARFLWTSAIDGATALAGVVLWLWLAKRRSGRAALSSIVVAAILVAEARIVTFLWT